MTLDPELEVIARIGELDPEARRRVLRWATERYWVTESRPPLSQPAFVRDWLTSVLKFHRLKVVSHPRERHNEILCECGWVDWRPFGGSSAHTEHLVDVIIDAAAGPTDE